jgi:magnesium-protoporphyrin IX monomethyl ester (oxidative) cyclase
MVRFRNVALLPSHPQIPLFHAYHIPDLTELCGLAACIRDDVDNVTIPVTPVDRDPLASFTRFMKRQRPDLVGISCFTCSARSALDYARIARRHGATVAIGGYHPSARPEEILGSPDVDLVVRGEGEQTLRELVRGDELDKIAGLSFKADGEMIHNPDRDLIEDLDTLPLPLRELRPPRFGLSGLDYHTDTIYASRGCRGRCAFCANHLVGKSWRQRSNQAILEELLSILPPRTGKWKIVKFWDSAFLTFPERIEELCDLIIENRLERQFRFIAETRVEDVIKARDILGKMRRAGIVRIGCGIESPNRETHRQLNKGINLSHVAQAAELLNQNRMLFSKFLIVGHSCESADDILAYTDYSLSHGVDLQNTTFFILTPYPGTETARQLQQQGQIKSDDWNLYTNMNAVIEANGLSPLQLQILFSVVRLKYGVYRRFLAGKSFLDAALKLLEGLLMHAKLCLQNRDYSRQEIEASLWLVLVQSIGNRQRQRKKRSRPLGDRVALYFHYQDQPPIVARLEPDGDQEILAIRQLDSAAAERRGRSIHLSVPRLVAFADMVDRRPAHDIMALYWSGRSFKPSWLPSLALDLSRVMVALVGMLGFHLKRTIAAPRNKVEQNGI